MSLSVLMPVYIKENPEYLAKAFESLLSQTFQAKEIILVEDGPLTKELYRVVEQWSKKLPIKRLSLIKNVGLGLALQKGLLECQGEIVARMDSDDISVPDRFLKQWQFLEENPTISIVGSWIAEFNDNPDSILTQRKLPLDMKSIPSFAKRRNPLNHMTVMFRKKDILQVGSYQPLQGFEDYFLWMRLFDGGFLAANLGDFLVLARISTMIQRRRGVDYFLSELNFQKKLYQMGILNLWGFLSNVATRGLVRLLPKEVLSGIYHFFLRQRISDTRL